MSPLCNLHGWPKMTRMFQARGCWPLKIYLLKRLDSIAKWLERWLRVWGVPGSIPGLARDLSTLKDSSIPYSKAKHPPIQWKRAFIYRIWPIGIYYTYNWCKFSHGIGSWVTSLSSTKMNLEFDWLKWNREEKKPLSPF